MSPIDPRTTGPDAASRLTGEQSRPLGVIGASVSLSAGAGCGKTTVLTERFLATLEAGGPLRSLVALTFTEKAARELRKRIRKECHERLRRGPHGEVASWRAVLRGLEAAPVGTFHEYCAGLLRRHALQAGLDPDFEILDAAIAGSVLDEALTRAVRRWLSEENEDLVELAVEFGLRRAREGLEWLVRGRSAAELSAWAARTEDELLATWRDAWEREGRAALLDAFVSAHRDCVELLAANPCRNPVMAGRVAAILEDFASLREVPDPAVAVERIEANARVQGGGKAADWPSAEVFDRVKNRLEKFRGAIARFRPRLVIDEEASRRAAGLGLRFARLAAAAREAYDEAKATRDGLDFDDLLVKTRDLLRVEAAAEAVRSAGGQPVEAVLVDEFQDTDPVQAEVLKRLCGDGFAGGRLFVVGDFKQSIYRFRGAEPRIFQEFRDALPESGRHDLTENFRSTVGVIDFINALFETAFGDETPRLVPGPDSAPAGDGPAVEFVWAEEPVRGVGEGERQKAPAVDERRRTEARWLARLIRSRILAGWPVRDRDTRLVRSAGYQDVAFLFRAMTDLTAYEQALEAERIDYHVVGGKAFYAQDEVRDLVNVLSVIEDPFDPVALAGSLRGPFFGLSDEALYWLGTVAGGLADGFEAAESIPGLSSSDRRQAARARRLLGRWRGMKDHLPIAGLVDRVLDESGFEAALLGERLGDRKRANARKMVRLARRFDARGGFTLADFVVRLRADLRAIPREEQASTTEEEGTSVRLMSIHQAKGLEFPIVVVPDLNRKSSADRDAVVFHPALGPLVRAGAEEPAEGEDGGSGRSLGWSVYEALEHREDEAESVRLFYVATTRARDALILSAGAGPAAKPESPALRLLDGRFDRLTGACRAAFPAGTRVPLVRVTTEFPPAPMPAAARVRRPWVHARLAERTIRAAPIVEGRAALEAIVPPAPRFVDLDRARRLAPRSERLDRLIRSVLADRRVPSRRDARPALAEAVRRAGRGQDPIAHPELIAEAVRLLDPWLAGPLGASLASAVTLERGVEWTLTWPHPGGESTVFRGSVAFFARDPVGAWSAWTFSPPGASEPVERLRLLLSARAADSLGYGPVAHAWRVRLGDGPAGEESFGEDVVAAAVAEALAAIANARGL